MEAGELVRLVGLFEVEGLRVWLDGGWGVDALLERQTREHDDLDLVSELADSERVIALLEAAGYELGDKDYRELCLLHERFGVRLPESVVDRALAMRDR